MTPASVIRGVLAVAGMVAPLIPSAAASGIIGDVVDALAPLPDLVDELGDGEWTDDDVTALRDALVVALDGAPGIPGWHARRIAGGVAAVTALIVAAARKEAPARARRDRVSASVTVLRDALAARAVGR